MSSCISRAQHVLSTHRFFEEADFNGYIRLCFRQRLKSRRPILLCALLDSLPPACGSRGEIALNESYPAGWKLVPKITKKPKEDHWEHAPYTNQITRGHVNPRSNLLSPIDSDCRVNLQGLARQRYTVLS